MNFILLFLSVNWSCEVNGVTINFFHLLHVSLLNFVHACRLRDEEKKYEEEANNIEYRRYNDLKAIGNFGRKHQLRGLYSSMCFWCFLYCSVHFFTLQLSGMSELYNSTKC
ncbi:PREDICTED: uncharacterized protein LOC109207540 [Nicotiana attenuata]|uniref:Uncharacterized protein n=1 Tax=Nicotiana attenuata TaxID=49451 RepID=A0A1J6IP09_NICAT|nr:PREDICTED: uncharacterized protein LOC109207540 [Nicotiana attenuata]OIT06004.1 hypothetical protein A4A49_16133 [Nicotiana attenuata]